MRQAWAQAPAGENQGEKRQRGEKRPALMDASVVNCILCQNPRPLVLIIVTFLNIVPFMWRHSLGPSYIYCTMKLAHN